MATLELIDLDLPRTGYRKFITAWLYRSDEFSFLVDPGPPSAHPRLMERLGALGLETLDLILLTHVHLDHGGGAGHLLREYPAARVCCLPRVAHHLIDPSHLWAGSLALLGGMAEFFGRPRPVVAEAILTPDDLAAYGIRTIPTPGHAAHHVCYLHDGILFAGEAAGVRYPLDSGRIYLRPATPPPFRPEIAVASLARLLSLHPGPTRLAFAHYGLVEDVSRHLEIAVEQIGVWQTVVAESLRGGGFDPSLPIETGLLDRLMAADPSFAAFPELPADIRQREREFLQNTVHGLTENLQRDATRPR